MLVTRTMLMLAAIAIAALAQPPSESARSAACTNRSLLGAFSFTATGFTVPGSPVPPPFQGRFASGGTSVFDGEGSVTLTATSSFNGLIQGPATVRGTYNVNADCMYTSSLENGASFRGVIVDNGHELFILQTNTAVINTGVALRQDAAVPAGTDLRGIGRPLACLAELMSQAVYGFISEGAAGPPAIPAQFAGPLADVGTVAFSPNGTFELNAQRSINGNIDPAVLTLAGAYTFNPDCTFRIVFDVGFTFNGMVADGGRRLLFLETNAGTTFVVNAKRI
jgi:hypothetical protein